MRTNHSYFDGSVDDSAGVVELANLRCMFYIRSYDILDVVFYSLLNSARDAYAVIAGISLGGSEKAEVGIHAETYMAGLLLSDGHFVSARVLSTRGHHYLLDFVAGTIQLRTEIHAVQQQSSALFTVEGHIRGNGFVVRNAVTGRVLAQISEEEIKKPNFLTQELSFLSHHTQLDPTLAASTGTADLVDLNLELQLSIPPVGEISSILIRKDKGDLQVQVRDGQTDQALCVLPLESLNNLGQMMEKLQKFLSSLESRGRLDAAEKSAPDE